MSGYWRAAVDVILDRLLADNRFARASDEEIVGYVIDLAPASLRFPAFERRMLVEEVGRRRKRPDEPTALAVEKISEMTDLYPVMQRSVKGGRVSREMMARRLGIDRGTLSEWERRGWTTFPPAPKNPQP